MRQPIKFGKYLLLERIAVGGMAEVFVAKAFGVEGFERLLAIKKILPTMGEDAEFISMFVDEARIAVQLSHANIVQVLELGKHDEHLYIAMEYISGRDLRQVIERFRKLKQPMPIPQACLMVAEVCEALDYAHRKRGASGRPLGIVHRDVSPQNVLVSFEGETKLIDFGIAKAESRLQKTQAGILKGKFSYMSPEQVKGLPIDGRSDIFAAGILLWELVCGEKLFTGDSDFAILEKVRQGLVPAPRSVTRSCPEGLEKVILKALATEPTQRYQTASELHDDLMRFTRVGEVVYGSRLLAEWLREEFAQEWDKEQARLRGWLEIGEEKSAVTPAEAHRRREAPIEAASSEPTQQFRIAPDEDTLASPPTPQKGVTPVQLPPPSDSHELPTMKMDGDALAEAEREFDLSEERTGARRKLRTSPLVRPHKEEPRPVWKPNRRALLYIGAPLVLAALAALWFGASREPEARPGKIAVMSTPSVGADLWIDGRLAGQLPLVHTLVAGRHHVEVRAEGYKPFSTQVAVPSGGAPVQVEAQLVADGPMQVEGVMLTQPEPVAQKAESSPPEPQPKRKHGFQKKNSAVASVPQPLTSELLPVVEAAPVPSAAVGYLTAATKPAARLTIDGRDTGRWTPVPSANPIALPAGAHTLLFETADGRKLEEQLEIEPDKTSRVIRSLP